MGITRMNHAVLYVRDARRTADFYQRLLGFKVIIEGPAGQYVFLRAPDSDNHHDLALFTIGSAAGDSPAGRSTVGLYHIAWEVPTLEELAAVQERLAREGVLIGAATTARTRACTPRTPTVWSSRSCGWSPPSSGARRSTRRSSGRSTSRVSGSASPL